MEAGSTSNTLVSYRLVLADMKSYFLMRESVAADRLQKDEKERPEHAEPNRLCRCRSRLFDAQQPPPPYRITFSPFGT